MPTMMRFGQVRRFNRCEPRKMSLQGLRFAVDAGDGQTFLGCFWKTADTDTIGTKGFLKIPNCRG